MRSMEAICCRISLGDFLDDTGNSICVRIYLSMKTPRHFDQSKKFVLHPIFISRREDSRSQSDRRPLGQNPLHRFIRGPPEDFSQKSGEKIHARILPPRPHASKENTLYYAGSSLRLQLVPPPFRRQGHIGCISMESHDHLARNILAVPIVHHHLKGKLRSGLDPE